MRRSTAFGLTGILLLALALRLFPLTQSLYWGADFGEYHAITQGLLADGRISLDYRGWGTAYPYFPGMHIVQAAAVFAGVPPLLAEAALIPALSSLAVLVVFLIAATITRHDGVGLIAAAFLAVAMPHVYATAHAIPGAIGDLMFGACLLLILRLRTDRRALAPLLLITAALIVTHHLSTYFLLVTAIFAFLLRIVVNARSPGAWREGIYLAILVPASFAYWIFYALPFQRQIFPQIQVPWPLLLAPFVFVVPLLLGIRKLRPRWRWTYVPKYPPRARTVRLLAATIAFIFAFLGLLFVVGVPGTSIRLPTNSLIVLAPLLVLFAMSASGRRFADFYPGGIDLSGWFVVIALSAALGTAVATTVLIPYRHTQYILWPVAVFVGLAFLGLFGGARRSGRVLLVAALLLVAAIPAAYPGRIVFVGHEERIPAEALNSPRWLADHGWGLVGSDHMGSMESFGFGGIDAVWDYTTEVVLAEDFASAREAFANASFPAGHAPIRFVVLNNDIRAGAMLYPWDPAPPMSPAAAGKFEQPPFQRVFDDGYSTVYYLNWGLA